jgi:hypothetical protein
VTRANPPTLPATTPPSAAERRRPLRDFTTLFPLYRRTPALSPSLPTDTDEADEVGRLTEVAEKNQTQVVIVVEMPSLVSSRRRHHCHSSRGSDHKKRYSYYSAFSKSETLVETHDKMREELIGFDCDEVGQRQYCIGIHCCPSPLSTKLKDEMEPLWTTQSC